MQWMRLLICCGKAVKNMGILWMNVRKMKALTEYGDTDNDWYRLIESNMNWIQF